MTFFDNCNWDTELAGYIIYSPSASPDPNQGDRVYTDPGCTDCGQIIGLASQDLGGFTVNGDCSMTSCTPSDRRLKKAISTLQNSLNSLMNLSVKEYDWSEDSPDYEFNKSHDRLHDIGLIAQELMEHYPQMVYQRDNGYYGIIYEKLNAVLIESVKEQNDMISIIEDKINLLKSKL
jgi:hypothetical protein